MSPADDGSSLDATSTVIRLMRHQARGLLVSALLRSNSRERFESLIETTEEDRPPRVGSLESRPVLARAGSLLLKEASYRDFAGQLGNDLIENLGAIFWVEMSEYLIRDTTCKFRAFGDFKRFSSALSFIPEFLWLVPTLPSIVPESATDYGLDALCRFALDPVRHNAREVFKSKFRASAKPFSDFGAELLRDKLHSILSVLGPPPQFVANVFSSVIALASYYAFVIAFDAAIRVGPVSVPGVGAFRFEAGIAVNRIDFLAEDSFWKLIKINAKTPSLPDEISPPSTAAA